MMPLLHSHAFPTPTSTTHGSSMARKGKAEVAPYPCLKLPPTCAARNALGFVQQLLQEL